MKTGFLQFLDCDLRLKRFAVCPVDNNRLAQIGMRRNDLRDESSLVNAEVLGGRKMRFAKCINGQHVDDRERRWSFTSFLKSAMEMEGVVFIGVKAIFKTWT